ncbi:hypothetical protein BDR26DRAFT_1012815 [Obelidium mucronatum]|nr:hypothetical protein BDR26DRAFT_1012815 [Obelidium mucronatum]
MAMMGIQMLMRIGKKKFDMPLTEVDFVAEELQSDATFKPAQFSFKLTPEGATVSRNGILQQTLIGPHVICSVEQCGLCCTDLARYFLPYPLPQCVGHEALVDVDGKRYAVEINSACHQATCLFCSNSVDLPMPSQCPQRITMGINTWHGAMAPYLIAPKVNLVQVPENTLSMDAATMIEPFAAALHGVDCSSAATAGNVAVLGAGRLGLMTVLALNIRRTMNNSKQSIVAIVRDDKHAQIARDFGADNVIIVPKDQTSILQDAALNSKFDVVFDTTGSPDGLQHALTLSNKEIHLKSTHGQKVLGLKHMTEMVVAELALVPCTPDELASRLEFSWMKETIKRDNKNVYCSPSVPQSMQTTIKNTGRIVHSGVSIEELNDSFENGALGEMLVASGSPFPRFDLAVVTSLDEIDGLIQPSPSHDRSLVRPRGAILLVAQKTASPTSDFLANLLVSKRISITTSRCGDFNEALKVMLQENGQGGFSGNILEKLVTHRYQMSQVSLAFDIARGGGSRNEIRPVVKILIQNRTN